jgi:hypothetical protein
MMTSKSESELHREEFGSSIISVGPPGPSQLPRLHNTQEGEQAYIVSSDASREQRGSVFGITYFWHISPGFHKKYNFVNIVHTKLRHTTCKIHQVMTSCEISIPAGFRFFRPIFIEPILAMPHSSVCFSTKYWEMRTALILLCATSLPRSARHPGVARAFSAAMRTCCGLPPAERAARSTHFSFPETRSRR